MSVANYSRWKFNLIVSIEILIYKTTVGAGKFLDETLRSGGGLLELLGLTHREFPIISNKF
jgi:hypothetical protein